jgi:hypothetical protein
LAQLAARAINLAHQASAEAPANENSQKTSNHMH